MTPEQKLELLKEYMAYWVEYRYWEKRDAVTLLECFKRYDVFFRPKIQPLLSFEAWMAQERRAEKAYNLIKNRPINALP